MKKPPQKKSYEATATTKMPIAMEMKKERSFLSIDEKDLKAIKNWAVGKKYKLLVDVEMTGLKKEEYGDKDMRGEFRINKIKAE